MAFLAAIVAAGSLSAQTWVERFEIQTVLSPGGDVSFVQAITYRWFDSRFIGDRPSGWCVAQWEMVSGTVFIRRPGIIWHVRYLLRDGTERSIWAERFLRTSSFDDHERQNVAVYPESMRVAYELD